MDRELPLRVVILIVLIGIFLSFEAVYTRLTRETVSVTVQDSYIKRVGKIDYFFIVTDEGETFVNHDVSTLLKFNSADFQSQLKVGRKVKVDVTGWRIPILSSFRNIVFIHR